ncbi:MAG TPA: AAA family ATPase, partial [Polyangiaceae bacterium]|nr:AAA family ATPase [Polyangiaceae bacterium]
TTSLRRAVKAARRALVDSGELQASIQTVVGCGYRFVQPVEHSAPDRAVEAPEPSPRAQLQDAGDSVYSAALAEPFVGRDAVLSVLDASLERAFSGSGSVSVLRGEPGIGKTRTAHELARRAAELGSDVLIGRCMEVEGAPPFWPWLQMLRQFLGLRGEETVRRLLGTGTADVVDAMPALRAIFKDLAKAPRIHKAHARFRLFESMAEFLVRACSERPLTLIFDDLQRADQPTLTLLVFLASHLKEARLLVLGTSRPTAEREGEVSLLIGELLRSDTSSCISLTGLQAGEVARYLELTVGCRPPEEITRAVHEKTGGNPLFLRHLVHNFVAAGRPVGWAWLDRVAADHNLQESIERWLGGLPHDCRRLLQVAAVIGSEFSLATLADTAGLAAADVLETLCEAELACVVRRVEGDVGCYRYAHALVRDLLYDQLAQTERARLHGRVGAALRASSAETDADKLSELAHHFVQAAPVYDDGLALVYAERAAHVALSRFAYEEAALHFERALQVSSLRAANLTLRLELLLQRGEALACADRVADARATLDRAVDIARGLGAVEALARAAIAMSIPLEYGTVDREHVGLLEEVLALLPESDERCALLRGILAKSLLYSGELERRTRVAREAVQSARTLVDLGAQARTLRYCLQALSEPEQYAERRVLTDQLIELARTQNDHQLLLHACLARIQAHLELGELAAVDRAISDMEALAAHARQPYFRWIATAIRAMRATIAGQLPLASTLADEALQFGRRFFDAVAHGTYCVQMTGIWCLQGHIDWAEATVRQISSRYPALSGWRAILGFLEAQLGHTEQARREFQRLTDRDLESARRDPFVLSALAPLADLGALVGDSASVRLLYEALKPYAGYHAVVMGGMFTHGPVERHLGMLAAKLKRFEAAARHFERAIEQSEKMPSVPYLCLTRQSYALMLAKAGAAEHRERASLELGLAFSASQAHGIHQVSEFCRRTAQRHGLCLPDAPALLRPVSVVVERPQAIGRRQLES